MAELERFTRELIFWSNWKIGQGLSRSSVELFVSRAILNYCFDHPESNPWEVGAVVKAKRDGLLV